MQGCQPFVRGGAVLILSVGAAVGLLSAPASAGGMQLPATTNDFFGPGTQQGELMDTILSFSSCGFCHAGWSADPDPGQTPYHEPGRWLGSMHAHSVRDPLFGVARVIAKQDAGQAAETFCFRCHSPRAWEAGRANDPDNPETGLFPSDIAEGVNCNACHRMVDPIYNPGVSPSVDQMIINALASAPTEFGNANIVFDPIDVRRGPFDFPQPGFEPPHAWLYSPFHQEADMCGSCHDVSNPVHSRVGGMTPAPTDSYAPNAFDAPHPTATKLDMFPEQRTYSEFLNSAYAQPGGVDTKGRFGGNEPVVDSCQGCHMPRVTGTGCNPFLGPSVRENLPYHSWQGANRWILDMILHVYDGELDSEQIDMINVAKVDTENMLALATDTTAIQYSCELTVRVTNHCGHKLLTGYPEGRRIWVNVKFFDGMSQLIEERGYYDTATADLVEDTKVYQTKHGIDATVAAASGQPEGESFHLALNNKLFFDNRIPPMGYTNAAFEAVQAHPVGYSYDDGQHWDDTRYAIPTGAASAEITLYYQTSSKEYIEFLRDEVDAPAPNVGTDLYDAWVATGKSAPVVMDNITVPIAPFLMGDATNDGTVDVDDLNVVLSNWLRTDDPGVAFGDLNKDGMVDVDDLNVVLSNWNTSL